MKHTHKHPSRKPIEPSTAPHPLHKKADIRAFVMPDNIHTKNFTGFLVLNTAKNILLVVD